MSSEEMNGKVIKFRDPNYALFSPTFRKKIERELTGVTDKPSETIDALESAICNAVVAFFRNWATRLGSSVGEKLGAAIGK